MKSSQYLSNDSLIFNFVLPQTIFNEIVESENELINAYLDGDKLNVLQRLDTGSFDVNATVKIRHAFGFEQDNPKYVHYSDVTLLHLALKDGDLHLAEKLIDLGADPMATIHKTFEPAAPNEADCFWEKSELSVLDCAILSEQDDLTVLQFLHTHGFDLQNVDPITIEVLDDHATNAENDDLANFMFENFNHDKLLDNIEYDGILACLLKDAGVMSSVEHDDSLSVSDAIADQDELTDTHMKSSQYLYSPISNHALIGEYQPHMDAPNQSPILKIATTDGLIQETILSGNQLCQAYLQGEKEQAIEMITQGQYSVDASMDVSYQFEKHCSPDACGINQDTYDFGKTEVYTNITLLHLAVLNNDSDFATKLIDLGANYNTKIDCHIDSHIEHYNAEGELDGNKQEFSNDFSHSIIALAIESEDCLQILNVLKQVGFDFNNLSTNDYEALFDYASAHHDQDVAMFMLDNCDWENLGGNLQGILDDISSPVEVSLSINDVLSGQDNNLLKQLDDGHTQSAQNHIDVEQGSTIATIDVDGFEGFAQPQMPSLDLEIVNFE